MEKWVARLAMRVVEMAEGWCSFDAAAAAILAAEKSLSADGGPYTESDLVNDAFERVADEALRAGIER